MFVFSLSCRMLIVRVELRASSEYISFRITVITTGFIWLVLSSVPLLDKVNKQKVTEHQKISA